MVFQRAVRKARKATWFREQQPPPGFLSEATLIAYAFSILLLKLLLLALAREDGIVIVNILIHRYKAISIKAVKQSDLIVARLITAAIYRLDEYAKANHVWYFVFSIKVYTYTLDIIYALTYKLQQHAYVNVSTLLRLHVLKRI